MGCEVAMKMVRERVCDECGSTLGREVVRVTRVTREDGSTALHVQCRACSVVAGSAMSMRIGRVEKARA